MPVDKELCCQGSGLLSAAGQRVFAHVWWGRCRFCSRSIKLTKRYSFRRHRRVTKDRPAQLPTLRAVGAAL